jgi:hypothetical protein
LSGTTTIPHGLPSKLILFSCLPSSDNTITSVLLLLHNNKWSSLWYSTGE